MVSSRFSRHKVCSNYSLLSIDQEFAIRERDRVEVSGARDLNPVFGTDDWYSNEFPLIFRESVVGGNCRTF